MKKKNLNGILKGFHKTIADLETLSNKNMKKVEKQIIKIEKIQEKNKATKEEAIQADNVAYKLKKMVGLDD